MAPLTALFIRRKIFPPQQTVSFEDGEDFDILATPAVNDAISPVNDFAQVRSREFGNLPANVWKASQALSRAY